MIINLDKLDNEILNLEKEFQLNVSSGSTIHKFVHYCSLAKGNLTLARYDLQKSNDEKFKVHMKRVRKAIIGMKEVIYGQYN